MVLYQAFDSKPLVWDGSLSSLEIIPDISKWDMSNVTDVSYMFYECQVIRSLPNISKWKTNKFNDLSNLFLGCTKLLSFPDISK